MDVKAGSGAMFDGIAEKYDLLNRLTSLGMDRHWRGFATASLESAPGDWVLDLAAGTMDVSLELVEQCYGVHVVAADPSLEMMRVGKAKCALRPGRSVYGALSIGEALPFGDEVFNGVIVAFGIRNFPDRPRALKEIYRVLKPGGRLAILELTLPRNGVLSGPIRWYVARVIPWLGGLLSGRAAYAYLPRSIAAFPTAEAFAKEMDDAGFEVNSPRRFMFGAAHLFVAQKEAC